MKPQGTMDKVLAQIMGLWPFSCLWGTATGTWGEGKLRLGELEARARFMAWLKSSHELQKRRACTSHGTCDFANRRCYAIRVM